MNDGTNSLKSMHIKRLSIFQVIYAYIPLVIIFVNGFPQEKRKIHAYIPMTGKFL